MRDALAHLDAAFGVGLGWVVPLVDPRTRVPLTTPEGERVRIFMEGECSPAWDDAQARVRQLLQLRWPMTGPLAADEIDSLLATSLAAATVGWRGVALDGRPLTFSTDAAFTLYCRLPWIVEQIDERLGAESEFRSLREILTTGNV